MFPQLEEKFCNVGGEGFGAIPVKNGNGGTSVNDRIPKMNFGRREVKNWGDAEGDKIKGLEVGK